MLIEAHTHLDHYSEADLATALAEIEAHQILTISNAVDVPSYRRNLEISRRSELIIPTLGIHPWWAAKSLDQLVEAEDLVNESPLIGEIGLDYHWLEDETTYPAQRQIFEFFLQAAQSQDKIVTLHTKGAEAEILALLDQVQIRRAIIHWYSGPLDILTEMINRAYDFTIGIEVLHSEHIQTIARQIPTHQLLTETDNPGGWAWFTKEAGMPRHLLQVVDKLAELHQTTPAAIEQIVQENLVRLAEGESWMKTV